MVEDVLTLNHCMLEQHVGTLIRTGTQGKRSERLKVSVHAVVESDAPSNKGTAQQASTVVRLLLGFPCDLLAFHQWSHFSFIHACHIFMQFSYQQRFS